MFVDDFPIKLLKLHIRHEDGFERTVGNVRKYFFKNEILSENVWNCKCRLLRNFEGINYYD